MKHSIITYTAIGVTAGRETRDPTKELVAPDTGAFDEGHHYVPHLLNVFPLHFPLTGLTLVAVWIPGVYLGARSEVKHPLPYPR